MSRAERTMNTYSWLVAINSVVGIATINYDTNEKYQKAVLPSSTMNVEDIVIRKQLIEQLSNDAKKMINLIINGDDKVIKKLTTKTYNVISKTLIKSYYIKLGYSDKFIEKVFKELKEFVLNLTN
jgi:hypothetical protein